MFEKVVFLGKRGLTLDGLLREFGAVRAEAPNVVLIDIGMNDLCNGCVAEELAEGIVAFARKLTTISYVLHVVICHILTRIPKSSGRFLVPGNFEPACHAISVTLIRLTIDFDNIHFWPHCKLFDAKHFARDGVHMSAIGMKKYVNSMRKAAIHAFMQCQKQV